MTWRYTPVIEICDFIFYITRVKVGRLT